MANKPDQKEEKLMELEIFVASYPDNLSKETFWYGPKSINILNDLISKGIKPKYEWEGPAIDHILHAYAIMPYKRNMVEYPDGRQKIVNGHRIFEYSPEEKRPQEYMEFVGYSADDLFENIINNGIIITPTKIRLNTGFNGLMNELEGLEKINKPDLIELNKLINNHNNFLDFVYNQIPVRIKETAKMT